MKRVPLLVALTALVACSPVSAWAAPASTRYSSDKTPIGTLLADPASRQAVARQFPDILSSRAVAAGMANRMTLRSLNRFRPKEFTDDRLAKVDADLAQLPPK